jgi:hypothetical protein
MKNKSISCEPELVVGKIRHGEILVFVAVAEEPPDAFRTHAMSERNPP